MQDIQERADIELLVKRFYEKVMPDPLIGAFFTSVVHFSWEVHIPVMISFWESVLLGVQSYKGNPMVKHIELNALQRLEPAHFERWLALWEETVKTYYRGEKAQMAIDRAHSIAKIMQAKIKAE